MMTFFNSIRGHFFSKTEETPFCRSITQTLALGVLCIAGGFTVGFICLKSREIKFTKNIRDLATWAWQKIFPSNTPPPQIEPTQNHNSTNSNTQTNPLALTPDEIIKPVTPNPSSRPSQKPPTFDISSISLDDLATNFEKKLKVTEWINKQFKTHFKNGEQAVASSLQPIFSRAQQDEKLWECLIICVLLNNPYHPRFIAGVMEKIALWPSEKLKKETLPELLAKKCNYFG